MEAVKEGKPLTAMQILFVDDEKNVLQSLRRLFMDEEHEIILANSGEEALDIIKDNPNIGLIVSDQRMPGLTGVDFLEKARKILPDALRILLTGYADINAVADAINRGGAYRYITKPWKDEELIQIIGEAVQQYSLRKENKRLQKIIEKQNDELQRWNAQLEYFVQEQTLEIQKKNTELEKLNDRLRANFKNSIVAFSSLVELRESGRGNHSKNVAELSVTMAKEMNLSADEIEAISVAAFLHDIGKTGMPDILFSMDIDKMDATQKKEYIQHAVRGQTVIDQVEDLRGAGLLIRHHHEWYNGKGFPDNISGDKIPLGSRIIGLADYIDRKIQTKSDNPFNSALKESRKELGERFDLALFQYIEKALRTVYTDVPINEAEMYEIEIAADDLKPSMVLSRDLKSGTGFLLLSKGVKLNEKQVQSLQRCYKLDPSKTGIHVWTKK